MKVKVYLPDGEREVKVYQPRTPLSDGLPRLDGSIVDGTQPGNETPYPLVLVRIRERVETPQLESPSQLPRRSLKWRGQPGSTKRRYGRPTDDQGPKARWMVMEKIYPVNGYEVVRYPNGLGLYALYGDGNEERELVAYRNTFSGGLRLLQHVPREVLEASGLF
ncbi:MAG: hypothetical protein QXY45_04220 [Candidatus Aenigmatarchaeota archaeon]